MIEHGRKLDDGQSGRGSVNTVTRKGDSVIRSTGAWSPAVHNLLEHLKIAGFRFSPRLLSTDIEHGQEELSYIQGEVSMRPWPEYLHVDAGMEQIGHMLREYHQSVIDYRPAKGAIWRVPGVQWKEGMIVRHGDLGPWNFVWKSDELVGLIDWDFAEPGLAVDDVAQAAWYCVPIRPQNRCLEAGVDAQNQGRRLAVLCEAYGIDPEVVIQALDTLQFREIGRTVELGEAGLRPWKDFLERGDIAEMEEERAWLLHHYINAQQADAGDALTGVPDL